MDCQAQAVRPFSPSFKAVVGAFPGLARYPAGPPAVAQIIDPVCANFSFLRGFGSYSPPRKKLKAPGFGHPDPPVPAITAKPSPKTVQEGSRLYNSHCSGCHGNKAVAGPLPDLRYATRETLEGIEGIVLGGSRASSGMPSFRRILNAEEVRAIQAYIVARAQESAKR